jgi:hypothetical protein
LIFGLGLVVGGFLGFAAGWMGFFHKVVKGGPGGVREVLFQRARDDLKLDYVQQEEVRIILKETSTELDGVTADVRPSVEATLARAEERMRAVLKPEQRRKFDAFMNDARRKWRPTPEPTKPIETPKPAEAPKAPAAPQPPLEPAKPTKPGEL